MDGQAAGASRPHVAEWVGPRPGGSYLWQLALIHQVHLLLFLAFFPFPFSVISSPAPFSSYLSYDALVLLVAFWAEEASECYYKATQLILNLFLRF